VVRSLAKNDLYRSLDIAKGFKQDIARAIAILAIAGMTLEKPRVLNLELIDAGVAIHFLSASANSRGFSLTD